MKLNVGVRRKIGLPDYSSAGANCNVEVELESGLLQHDVNAFQAQVREAFAAAQQAVDDELTRLQAQLAPPPRAALPAPQNGHGSASGWSRHTHSFPARAGAANGRTGAQRERAPKPCTPNQVRAIRAIARNLGCDLEETLREPYGVELPEQLTLSQASALIDSLKAASER